jgi:hypothetical protein
MSTPIFDRLNEEQNYENLVRWTPPAFVWGARYVVQLDKQPVIKPAPGVQTLGGAPYWGPTQE